MWNNEVFGQVDQIIKELEAWLVEREEQLKGGYVKEVEEDFMITKCKLDIWEKNGIGAG